MLASVNHFLPLTTIRRQRLLPTSGRLLVTTGQKVAPNDVIAEANLSPQHALLEVGRALGLTAEEVDPYIQRKMGERVTKGDVIAGPVGVLNRTVRAPQDGRIVAIGEGQVLMELEGPLFQLRAGLAGTITDLIEDRGAVVEATGALIQGMWGNGQSDKSLLTVLSRAPGDEFTPGQLDVSHRGAVILCGTCQREEVLQAAIDLPVRGIILASMPARLAPLALKAPFPILLVEGFGKMPMNQVAYTLLSTNEQREVVVNAVTMDRVTGDRPEVVIPLPTSTPVPPPPETDIFAPGQTVLIRCGPHVARAGTIATLKSDLVAFPGGAKAAAAVVRLQNGDQVVVPLANLDVIE
jgi:hypothetical protein